MVYILLADGFEEIEALAPFDALIRAGVETELVGVTGPTVTGGHGVAVQTNHTIDEIDAAAAEAVLVPGGLKGVQNLLASPAALNAIQAACEAGKKIGAICAGPTVLGALGILEGKSAVCYPGMEDQLTGAQPQPGATAVVDGDVITSRSAGTAWDFALAVLTELRGREAAETVARAIHYDHF